MSATEKPADPVTKEEIENAGLKVMQARAMLRLLSTSSCDMESDQDRADLQDALFLVTDWLEHCACDLGELAVRHGKHEGLRS
jgi:hypothetical protein